MSKAVLGIAFLKDLMGVGVVVRGLVLNSRKILPTVSIHVPANILFKYTI